ncbi:MAG: hypothetical protein WA708_11605 [Acidobacteriaceae bacterium]
MDMNTAGKSDIFEAVIQILILKSLDERGSANSQLLFEDLQRKTHGIPRIEKDSVYIALRKLETSGWVRKKSAAARDSGKWQLTLSATKCLPLEIKQWKIFTEAWPPILRLLKSNLD